MPSVQIHHIKPIIKQGNKGRPKKMPTIAEQVDTEIQTTIALKFAPMTANMLAGIADDYNIQKDEFLAFAKRNLELYNQTVLEALGDKL